MEHDAVGFQGDNELCPVCIAIAQRDALVAALEGIPGKLLRMGQAQTGYLKEEQRKEIVREIEEALAQLQGEKKP